MTPFDLLFILVALALVVTGLRGLYLLLTARWHALGRLAIRAVLGVAIYLGILLTVSLLSPQRILQVGESQCADEWCIAVTGSIPTPVVGSVAAQGTFEVVTVRVSNQGRGRRQRESDVHLYLSDSAGHRYESSPEAERALVQSGVSGDEVTDEVDPGSSHESHLAFDVPANATGLALIKSTYRWTPARLVIGDPQSVGHRRTLMRLHDGR